MTQWALRKAHPDDAGALAACIDAAYHDYRQQIADLPVVSANIADEIAQHHVWVAELDGEIIGGVVMIAEAGFMLLANVAVDPAHRGIGLGRALIALAESQAAGQGHGELRLTTHAAMTDNVALYERLGWQVDERGGNKVRMKKTI